MRAFILTLISLYVLAGAVHPQTACNPAVQQCR